MGVIFHFRLILEAFRERILVAPRIARTNSSAISCLVSGNDTQKEGRHEMKVMGFNGSPRKSANTQALVEGVLKGAAAKCDGCKKELGKCIQKDDLSPLLQEMKDCDAIVLGTPIYWFHVSSQLKTLIDRFYCFFGWEPHPETGELKEIYAFPKGKKFVIVTSRGDDENTKTLPELYQQVANWLNVVATAMGSSSTEFVNHYGSYNLRDSAREDTELMAKAESVGEGLV
jgi:multimeric flavodoxin WrbA